jgi:phosphopantetheinyl transferase (holo-ACP synthase)
MKALGHRVPWKAIEVVSTGGRPYVRYEGKRFEGLSISHERTYAVAVVTI